MASAPDILVTALDSPRILLVVEAKLQTKELADVESPLKRYMVMMGAPVGLVVTPGTLAIYRNQYTGTSQKSVTLIKRFDIPESWSFLSRFAHNPSKETARQRSSRSLDFEENVQSWLERLRASGSDSDDLSPELQDAFSDYILPALNEGIIRAAHPREYPT